MWKSETGEDSRDNILYIFSIEVKDNSTDGQDGDTFFYSIPQTGRVFAESPPVVSAVSDTVDDLSQNFPWPRTACFEYRSLL